ncbi:PEP-CTERM sorting domain-containing protein [Massilia yuzhufengensis]|uniref:PEP-CTERM protein-sorting domain-containing protein n=1 Tax=Massilia yuzhufengensis TaxID=1164594 RepID=A0A1I1RSY5_9BURK|nr:PEP-CTERM sorting domain-containing protein [Massilia yuzhufengensis]SFD37419.1 PEP-CTERM protein-sorting domain-containing protein [Massilia yuzhufengensis]
MFTKKILAAALFALAPFAAQAALTTSPPGWPPAGSSGLGAVQFNQVNYNNGGFVAMGAHGYKNGPTLPNNGVDTFFAQQGIYPGEPTKNYANWSFDFAFNTGNCSTCSVFLEVDVDPTAAVEYRTLFNLTTLRNPITNAIIYGAAGAESWNMEMPFMNAALGYDFNPFGASATSFRLSMVEGTDLTPTALVGPAAEITVSVPEPGTVALTGLAFAGMVFARRRKATKQA